MAFKYALDVISSTELASMYFRNLALLEPVSWIRSLISIVGMSDHGECPYLDSMIEQGLTTNEIYQLQSLLDKVWNTTPRVEAEHKIEGTAAHFDRYIAGDR